MLEAKGILIVFHLIQDRTVDRIVKEKKCSRNGTFLYFEIIQLMYLISFPAFVTGRVGGFWGGGFLCFQVAWCRMHAKWQ